MHRITLSIAWACCLVPAVAAAAPAASKVAPPKPATAARARSEGKARSPAAWLEGVQRAYRNKSVQATFTQTYTDAITGPRPTEKGTLLASGDGRVRFDYAEPHTKHFVFDGNSAYFYEPEAAQVTIMAHFGDEPAAQTMAFLWGDGILSTAFGAASCAAGGDTTTPPPTRGCLTLTPVQPMAGVEQVELIIDGSSFEMVQTTVTDALGNHTRYALTQRTLGAPIDAKRFDFVVPQGVSVLHTRI